MNKRNAIDGVLNASSFGIAGVSSNEHKFGSMLFKTLQENGAKVFPINPNLDSFMGEKCYPSVLAMDEKPESLIVSVSPDKTLKVAKEALEAGIQNIWFQQGAQSEETLQFCEENGINTVSKECVFMYYEPVKSIHKFHRGLAKIFGKYQRENS